MERPICPAYPWIFRVSIYAIFTDGIHDSSFLFHSNTGFVTDHQSSSLVWITSIVRQGLWFWTFFISPPPLGNAWWTILSKGDEIWKKKLGPRFPAIEQTIVRDPWWNLLVWTGTWAWISSQVSHNRSRTGCNPSRGLQPILILRTYHFYCSLLPVPSSVHSLA